MTIENNLTFVAASGFPLGNAGYLLPIFENIDGHTFEVGGSNFASSNLEYLFEDEAAIPFENKNIEIKFSTEENLKYTAEKADHYAFGAYVFYFSKELTEAFGGKEKVCTICSESNGVFVETSDERFKDFLFVLIENKDLIDNLIPNIITLCKQIIETGLKTKLVGQIDKLEPLTEGKDDALIEAAKAMMNITDRKHLDTSIRYYGSVFLLSPLKENFDVWLDMILSRWNHPIKDKQYWDICIEKVYWNICYSHIASDIEKTKIIKR